MEWTEGEWHVAFMKLNCAVLAVSCCTLPICIPKGDCITLHTAQQCLRHAVPSQQSIQHEHNLQRLRQLGPHDNLVSLLGFQTKPMPYLYLTEDLTNRCLLYLLVDDNTPSPRLTTDLLLRAALQVLEALIFLNERCLALRDVTTHNMAYEIKRDVRGLITNIHVKIANLGLTHHYKNNDDYDNPEIRPCRDPGAIPILWLPREALFYDKYDERSMVYSFGYIMNELLTRGCQPFTQMSLSTDDILLQLYLESPSVRAFQWPCVTDDMFRLIRWCTEFKPTDRPSLQQLKQHKEYGIRSLMQKTVQDLNRKVIAFPDINIDQEKRGYVPERGVRKIMKILAEADPNKYQNLRLSGWEKPSPVKVTNKECITSDSVSILTREGRRTVVTERLPMEFVHGDLQELETFRQLLPNVICWTSCRRLITENLDSFSQERLYEEAETLLDFARRLERNTAQRTAAQLCLNFARAIQTMHKNNCIHGDLRASNILVTKQSNKIIIATIGRVMLLREESSKAGKRFDDNARWAPPEVKLHGIYSKDSDVYSLMTTIWEVYNAIESSSLNPTIPDKHLAPLATVDLISIASTVETGVGLPELMSCPSVVENLIDRARNPDRAERPEINEVVRILEGYLQTGPKNQFPYLDGRRPVHQNKIIGGLQQVMKWIKQKGRREVKQTNRERRSNKRSPSQVSSRDSWAVYDVVDYDSASSILPNSANILESLLPEGSSNQRSPTEDNPTDSRMADDEAVAFYSDSHETIPKTVLPQFPSEIETSPECPRPAYEQSVQRQQDGHTDEQNKDATTSLKQPRQSSFARSTDFQSNHITANPLSKQTKSHLVHKVEDGIDSSSDKGVRLRRNKIDDGRFRDHMPSSSCKEPRNLKLPEGELTSDHKRFHQNCPSNMNATVENFRLVIHELSSVQQKRNVSKLENKNSETGANLLKEQCSDGAESAVQIGSKKIDNDTAEANEVQRQLCYSLHKTHTSHIQIKDMGKCQPSNVYENQEVRDSVSEINDHTCCFRAQDDHPRNQHPSDAFSHGIFQEESLPEDNSTYENTGKVYPVSCGDNLSQVYENEELNTATRDYQNSSFEHADLSQQCNAPEEVALLQPSLNEINADTCSGTSASASSIRSPRAYSRYLTPVARVLSKIHRRK